MYRTRVDPLLLWPSLLRPSQSSLLPGMSFSSSSRSSQLNRVSVLDAADQYRSPITDLDDEFKEMQERDFQPMFLSFPNHVLAELRPRFPLSPSLLTGKIVEM